ncbi:protein kinase [Marinomonas sp. SBI22]|uniref:leucine-rich repeat-containing protein kinase family protein n=1 Tax=unclassified Marinomonas TaxID=196814 RepID=UPI0007AF479C|nr:MULTISPECIES: leucine-rich repeat-containing protein kinase family protein [unclassified Marinomonas]KZM46121.1 protein kinase [Marinomonas sp. SBI22]KZM46531.1 protein kinase [Marinomonas sp. SBI8L]
MQTLKQLKNGELKGTVRLNLSENLSQFPAEIFDLADSLEVLDLSNNQLSELPQDLNRLKKLKILFCSNNEFTCLPPMLSLCQNLEMIGFKSNKITQVPASSLPLQTRWLILTDNKIAELPEKLGQLNNLEKLALSGNQLTYIPQSISNCHKLGLIRLSANALTSFPDALLDLPKLAWLAFAGNPFCETSAIEDRIKILKRDTFSFYEVLGKGASGVIYRATNSSENHLPNEVAIKVFKGEVTSDGYPEDELDACLSTGLHPNLVKPLAQIKEADCSALVMELIPTDYINLGQPPSLETCTRDTFTQGQSFSIKQIEHIVQQLESLVDHLIEYKVSHGDLYAHNVLINHQGDILFGDFGAASKYQMLEGYQQSGIQAIERRALNYFIDDMLSLCQPEDRQSQAYHQLKSKLSLITE